MRRKMRRGRREETSKIEDRYNGETREPFLLLLAVSDEQTRVRVGDVVEEKCSVGRRGQPFPILASSGELLCLF